MSWRILRFTALLLGVMFLSFGRHSSTGRHEEQPIQKLVESVRVRNPLGHKNLTLFPLTIPKIRDRKDYLTLDEATEKDYLKIREVGGGSVNEVEVENTSRHYVFLLAGELLIGCKQDRMVSGDCLLPPHCGKIRLRVYCTERSRWRKLSDSFKSLGEAVHTKMRQLAKETASQERVWEEVESKRERLGVSPSATQAFKKVVEDSDVQTRIEPYLDALNRIPGLGRDVCGVVAAVGDRILVADLFSSPELFEKLWPKLLRSYVLDVLEEPDRKGSLSRREVKAFLKKALDAEYHSQDTDGVGRGTRISSPHISGSALIHKEVVVHLDLFPRTHILRETPLDLDIRRQLRDE